jgi:hypothetical protein
MGDVALRGSLLRRGACSGEVARATTVEAGVAGGGSSGRCFRQAHHRRRGRQSLRCCSPVLTLRQAGSPLLLQTLLLVLGSRWIGGAVVVHRPVLRRSTTGWSGHNLPLLGFLVSTDGIVRDHDVADKLRKYPSSVERHALL